MSFTRVSVAEILQEKNPAVARMVPRFVVDYLRRIVHEEEVNYVLEHFADLPPFEFIRRTLAYVEVEYTLAGLEKLDPAGRYIFASNHPFGGMDGMMLAERLADRFGDVRVVVNDILMHLTPLRPIFVPVNKHGRQRGEYARAFNDVFSSDLQVLTFPAGLCSRRIDGRVQDLPWRPNFVKRAIQTDRRIVPIFVEGELSKFFYRLSAFRRALGIKANIEMLYLADELFAQRGRHFRMRAGDPIDSKELESFGTLFDQAAEVRRRVYALKG